MHIVSGDAQVAMRTECALPSQGPGQGCPAVQGKPLALGPHAHYLHRPVVLLCVGEAAVAGAERIVQMAEAERVWGPQQRVATPLRTDPGCQIYQDLDNSAALCDTVASYMKQ